MKGYMILSKLIDNPSPMVMMRAFTLLSKLVKDLDLIQASFIQSGCFEKILKILQNPTLADSNIPLLTNSLSIVNKICKSEPICEELVRKDGFRIISVFSDSALSTPVRAKAIQCVARLAANNATETFHPELILKCLQMAVLPNLSFKIAGLKTAAILSASERYGGSMEANKWSPALVGMMKEKDTKIIRLASIILANLAIDDEACDAIESNQAISVITDILTQKSLATSSFTPSALAAIDPLTVCAIRLLEKLCSCASCRDSLAEHGGISHLIEVLKRCEFDEESRLACLSACLSLAHDESWVVNFVSEGALPIFMMQMLVADHRNDSPRLLICVKLLRSLAEGSPDAAIPICLSGGMEKLAEMFTREMAHPGELLNEIALLVVALSSYEDCRQVLPTSATCLLFSLINDESTDDLVCEAIMRLVASSLSSPDLLDLVLFEGGIEGVVKCAQHRSTIVQSLALKSILLLAKLGN
jgi:hypothetical protein